MSDIRSALGSDSGLRGLVGDLRYDGTEEVSGVGTDHISGELDVAGLARADSEEFSPKTKDKVIYLSFFSLIFIITSDIKV